MKELLALLPQVSPPSSHKERRRRIRDALDKWILPISAAAQGVLLKDLGPVPVRCLPPAPARCPPLAVLRHARRTRPPCLTHWPNMRPGLQTDWAAGAAAAAKATVPRSRAAARSSEDDEDAGSSEGEYVHSSSGEEGDTSSREEEGGVSSDEEGSAPACEASALRTGAKRRALPELAPPPAKRQQQQAHGEQPPLDMHAWLVAAGVGGGGVVELSATEKVATAVWAACPHPGSTATAEQVGPCRIPMPAAASLPPWPPPPNTSPHPPSRPPPPRPLATFRCWTA